MAAVVAGSRVRQPLRRVTQCRRWRRLELLQLRFVREPFEPPGPYCNPDHISEI